MNISISTYIRVKGSAFTKLKNNEHEIYKKRNYEVEYSKISENSENFENGENDQNLNRRVSFGKNEKISFNSEKNVDSLLTNENDSDGSRESNQSRDTHQTRENQAENRSKSDSREFDEHELQRRASSFSDSVITDAIQQVRGQGQQSENSIGKNENNFSNSTSRENSSNSEIENLRKNSKSSSKNGSRIQSAQLNDRQIDEENENFELLSPSNSQVQGQSQSQDNTKIDTKNYPKKRSFFMWRPQNHRERRIKVRIVRTS